MPAYSSACSDPGRTRHRPCLLIHCLEIVASYSTIESRRCGGRRGRSRVETASGRKLAARDWIGGMRPKGPGDAAGACRRGLRSQSSAPSPLSPASSPSFLSTTTMQSLVAARSGALKQSLRGFASSAARAQAAPLQKPVANKQFKIYRWVCHGTFRLGFCVLFAAEG